MILNRVGNKKAIAKDIICHFPQHKTFIDMFFGAGGIFFNKPQAEYNYLNDLDDDVFNLWTVYQTDKDALMKEFDLMPVSDSLFQHWRTHKEIDPIKKAVRFLMLSNFGYMGHMETLRISCNNQKQSIAEKSLYDFKGNTYFVCQDFRKVLPKISFKDNNIQTAFIYADPPYLGTGNNYQDGFKEQDTIDLFDILVGSKIRFALSEFDNPIILELAKSYNLEIIGIGERRNMKNRRTEILVVNYESPALYSLFRNENTLCQI